MRSGQNGIVTEPRSGPPRVVLLDAMGTLLRLEPPVPRLAAALAAAGHPNPSEVVRAALGAEIAHYRAHMHQGRDRASLAELRRDCAAVLAEHLDDPPPADAVLPLLLDALRFTPYPDGVALLDRLAVAGIPAVVVSNWDCALPDHLERAGLLHRVAAVMASAPVGAAKPEEGIFRAALAAVGREPAEALHCGDDPVCDVRGAERLGIRAVLVDRDGRFPDAPGRVASLDEVLPGVPVRP